MIVEYEDVLICAGVDLEPIRGRAAARIERIADARQALQISHGES